MLRRMRKANRRSGNRWAWLALVGTIGVVAVALALLAPGMVGPWWRERAMNRTPRPVNVLLLTLDTTRADHIGAYGASQAETPSLDALAAQGTLFRRAYAHVPLTAPSHASLMTGLLPTRHHMRDNGASPLSGEFPLLSQRFHESGYRTGAFVSAFVLDRRFGLSRGFETYNDDVPASAGSAGDISERSVRAEETVERALTWIADADERPRFMWVHLFDPHLPYDAPEPFATRHRGRPYDGEIAYMDAQIARLLSGVRASGERPWLIVVAGDHGEGLGDHQELTHGYFVYGNTQHVPLMMALPGHVPAGRAIDAVVRGVDVAPTILSLAGLPALPDVDGRSLVPLMAGRRGSDPGPAYAESFHPRLWWGAQELLSLRTDRWLFVESPRPELYDVAADPGERTNLAAARPQELDEMRQQLRAIARPGTAIPAETRLDADAEKRLRALGYLGAVRTAAEPGDRLPDAKDNGPLLAAVTEGDALAVQGQYEKALSRFREALEKGPRSVAVRTRIAEALLSLGRHEEAFAAFGDLAASGGSLESAYFGMAKARLGQGRPSDALLVVRAGLAASPDSSRLHTEHGQLLLQDRRLREAEDAFRQTLAVVPDEEAALWGLGVTLSRQGRRDESVRVMLDLAERRPQSEQARAASEALTAWADERLAAGSPADAVRGYNAALGAGRESVATYLNLGLALFQAGRQRDVIAVLQKGAASFPDAPELQYRLGRILMQFGQSSDARRAFERTLQLAPNHAGATQALKER